MSFQIAQKPLNVVFLDSDKKPAWLLEEPLNGSMPCLVPSGDINDGTGAIVQSTAIASVALPPTEADKAALAALGGLLPALCGYCKGDASKNEALAAAVDKVIVNGEKHLASTGAAFFSGDAPGYADAHTITKLHVPVIIPQKTYATGLTLIACNFHDDSDRLHAVGSHFNEYELDNAQFPLMSSYCARMFALQSFQDTVYPDKEAIKGWGDERED